MRTLPDDQPLGVGNDVYGPARLALAVAAKPALEAAGLTWFLDAGTLLGAWRSGTLISHDDDFDTAAYLPSFRLEDLTAIEASIAAALPAPYQTRVVTSYARKIELFDPSSAPFELPPSYGGADFHSVTVDVQIMTDGPQGVVLLHDMLDHVRVPPEVIVPTGEIELEGYVFPSPHDVVAFLEAQYGYLGADSIYDVATKAYIKA